MNSFGSEALFIERYKETASDMFGKNFEELSEVERYLALGSLIRGYANSNWKELPDLSSGIHRR